MISYRKKGDAWVAFGPASELRVGQVTITKKDGSTNEEKIRAVSKPFDVDGVPHVYGYLDRGERKTQGQRELCWECGEKPGIKLAQDSSGIEGWVCDKCSRLSQWERSFA